MFSSGWGDGFYTSWWGLNAAGEVVELVTDFELLVEPISQYVELPSPLPRGRFDHALLREQEISARVPLLSRRTLILGGKGERTRGADDHNGRETPPQILASRSTVSGNFSTILMSRLAWAFGFARPCSQFSRVLSFVRR